MSYLQLFGSPDLTGPDGQRSLSVLSHPKRLALLAYLAMETPGGLHSRDKVLGLLWPESDVDHARNSLRQSLYFLRRRLPEGTLANLGESEIALDSSLLRCDVVGFEAALEAGHAEEALRLYKGDVLEGFFIPGAAPFEQWLENKRRHLRRLAVDAAWQLADQANQRNELAVEAEWGQRAVELDGSDEVSVRRLIEILGRLGNGAAAVRLYRDFSDRLAQEYELEPSPETVAMVEAVRSRAGSNGNGAASVVPSDQELGHEDADVAADLKRPQLAATDVGRPTEPPMGSSIKRWRIFRRLPMRGSAVGHLRIALGLVVVSLAATWLGGLLPSFSHGASDFSHGASDPPIKGVAVLPFRRIGPGDEDRFFADAMHEEILTQLSRVRSLRVIARSSVVDVQMDVEEDRVVADRLGVQYLIRGAIQITGDHIRIWTRLIDAASDEQLWASSLEGNRDDLFLIQMQTARQITEALDRTFPGAGWRPASRPTANLEAYEAYLKGRLHSSRIINPEDAHRAVQYLEEAVRLDPSFAAAWAMLSYARLLLAYQFTEDDQTPGAEAALMQATTLAPDDVETWLAQAYFYSYASQNYDRALTLIRKILEARPSFAPAKALEGFVLRRMGRWDEAATAMTAALELDPQAYSTTVVLAEMYMRMRRFDVAEHLLDRAIAIAPSGEFAYVEKALLYRDGRGDTAAARRILEAAPVSLSPKNRVLPAITDLYRRDYAAALDALASPTTGSVGRSMDEMLTLGLVHWLGGDRHAAASWADSVRHHLGKEPNAVTGGARDLALARCYAAVAAALSEQPDEAVRAARQAADLLPLSRDSYAGTDVLEWLVEVSVLTGRTGDAVSTLDTLLSMPSRVTAHVLELHPLFDSLRGDPRFVALEAQHDDVLETAAASPASNLRLSPW